METPPGNEDPRGGSGRALDLPEGDSDHSGGSATRIPSLG